MTTIDDALFDELADSVLDVSAAGTLPAELYTSPEVLAFERDVLYTKEWLCVGRAERIPEPGDWFTVTICDEPIIVAHDKTGEVRAMSAVCQHRAMQVCDGQGNSSTFKCPYHHWNYALDGRLLGAPAMERTADFDKADYGLPALAVEIWQGFVFVNLDVDAAPLAPTLAQYEPYLANYDLADAVCPGTFTLENMPWNWKVMFENFNDGYHANRLHQYVQDFCPSHLSEFPVEWDPESNVVFRTGGYTHPDGGFNATHHTIMPIFPKLTDEERLRSTFALIPRPSASARRPTSASSSSCDPRVPRRSTSRSATSSTPPRSRIRCSSTSSSSPTWVSRSSSSRTRTRRPRCSAACVRGSRHGAGTPGRRRATSGSTGGWCSGTRPDVPTPIRNTQEI